MMILIRFLKRNFVFIIINKCSSVFSKLLGLVHSFFYAKFNSFFSKTALNLSYIFTYIFLALLILINLVLGMYETYSLFSETTIDSLLNFLSEGGPNDKDLMDPLRIWSCGVPQSTAIVGTGLAVLSILSKMPGVSSRARVLGTLSLKNIVLGITLTSTKKISEASNNEAGSSISCSVINNFLPDSSDMENTSKKILIYVMETLSPILQPVQSQFSNEVLANQIHDISIILFIMSVLIMILILCLLINILVVLNSNRIINFFTNKYIRWYVSVNMKLIGIEVFCLGASIIYFMYNLSIGLHYIATHPIQFP